MKARRFQRNTEGWVCRWFKEKDSMYQKGRTGGQVKRLGVKYRPETKMGGGEERFAYS